MLTVAADQDIEVSFTLNGRGVSARCAPRMHLADFLRHRLHRTGTHIGCEHGVCGACTVLVDGVATRACLLYAVQVRGCDVRTVEGLAQDAAQDAAQGAALSDLQEAFHQHFALQCGFCTPGILMSATDFLERFPHPDEMQVRHFLSGHICRCTGYEGIVRAILATAAARRERLADPRQQPPERRD